MAICSNSAFAFSRLTYAKIPAHTGRKNLFYNVKKLSFSYWYNLFIAARKTQILLNGSYLPLISPMKKNIDKPQCKNSLMPCPVWLWWVLTFLICLMWSIILLTGLNARLTCVKSRIHLSQKSFSNVLKNYFLSCPKTSFFFTTYQCKNVLIQWLARLGRVFRFRIQ